MSLNYCQESGCPGHAKAGEKCFSPSYFLHYCSTPGCEGHVQCGEVCCNRPMLYYCAVPECPGHALDWEKCLFTCDLPGCPGHTQKWEVCPTPGSEEDPLPLPPVQTNGTESQK
jgi:hypothetical protein